MPEETALQQVVPQPIEAVTKLLSSESIEVDNGIILRPRCKLCNFAQRKQAEDIWEETKNASKVKEWLDKAGCDIAVQNIRHHMREHYGSMERALLFREYCEDLSRMLDQRRKQREDLELIVVICRKEIARCASLDAGGLFQKEKERNLMLMNATKMMKDAIGELNAMEDAELKAKAVMDRCVKTWQDMIDQAANEAERTLLRNLLAKFQKALEANPEVKLP